jgi:hypothetical protein
MVGTSGRLGTRLAVETASAANSAAGNVGRRHDRGIEHHRYLVADHILDRGAAALVGHVRHVELGGELEQFGREVLRRAVAGRRIGEAARLRPGGVDDVLHGLEGAFTADDQYGAVAADQDDRDERLDGS